MICHSKIWRSQVSGHALTIDYCVTKLLYFTIEIDWLISVPEEARRMLTSVTLHFSWIYYHHSCELVSNARNCLILTKRSKFLHLLPAPPNRHHQTVMQSYKCIVLRQANNLPFLSVFFMAMHWSGTVPLCDEGVYSRAYRYRSAFSCNSTEWSAVRKWFIYWRSINWRCYITSTDLVSTPTA